MEVQEKQVTLRVVTPSEGHILTQKADVDVRNRILSTELILGLGDSADNYKEITLAEAEDIQTEQNALIGNIEE